MYKTRRDISDNHDEREAFHASIDKDFSIIINVVELNNFFKRFVNLTPPGVYNPKRARKVDKNPIKV